MADPTIQTFCCHHRNNSDSAVQLMVEFNKDSYIIVCLASSSLGIIGALYQIFWRNEDETNGNKNYGRKIIIWLAVSDLCASIGIFIRSALWKYVAGIQGETSDTPSVIFCAVSSAWTQYFYTCTWVWTLCYALEIRRKLLKEPSNEKFYHITTWSTGAGLTVIGLTILYIPDGDCHDISKFSTAILRVLPNYCVTYLPMIMVMIVNPTLYSFSSKEIDKQLSLRLNQVTSRERKIMKIFKLKFSSINIIFYICWIPNLINGILLWTYWYDLPVKLMIVVWYLMAILNPLQALLNALVYRKWNFNEYNPKVNQLSELQRSFAVTENSPLLQQPIDWTDSDSSLSLRDEQSVNSCSCV